MMNANTRKIFDDAKARAIRRFGTSNLYFSEYPIFGGWNLDIRVGVMTDADRIFDMDYGEVRVMDDGTTKLSHRLTGEFDTVDELLDVLADRLSKIIKDYKDYVRMETEELLEAL